MKAHALESLMYRSRATQQVGGLYLLVFMMRAQATNRRLGITGRLCYSDGLFVQYLEGPGDALRYVWRSIQQDPRHDDIRVLKQEHGLQERRLPFWPMAFSADSRFELYRIPDFSHNWLGDVNDLFHRCGLPLPSERERRRMARAPDADAGPPAPWRNRGGPVRQDDTRPVTPVRSTRHSYS